MVAMVFSVKLFVLCRTCGNNFDVRTDAVESPQHMEGTMGNEIYDDLDELPAPPRVDIPVADLALLERAARAIDAVHVEMVDGEGYVNLHFAEGGVQGKESCATSQPKRQAFDRTGAACAVRQGTNSRSRRCTTLSGGHQSNVVLRLACYSRR